VVKAGLPTLLEWQNPQTLQTVSLTDFLNLEFRIIVFISGTDSSSVKVREQINNALTYSFVSDHQFRFSSFLVADTKYVSLRSIAILPVRVIANFQISSSTNGRSNSPLLLC